MDEGQGQEAGDRAKEKVEENWEIAEVLLMGIRIAQQMANPRVNTGMSFFTWRVRIPPYQLGILPKDIRNKHRKITLKANELTPDIFRQIWEIGGTGFYRIYSDNIFSWFKRGKIFQGYIDEKVVWKSMEAEAKGLDFLTIAKNIENSQKEVKK